MNPFFVKVEAETGFHAFENDRNSQMVFYGTSDKFDDFKMLVANKIPTGTMVILIDTGASGFYSAYTNQWY